MNFHEVNPHHKYQTFKSQTNVDKLTSNFKPFGGQAGNQCVVVGPTLLISK